MSVIHSDFLHAQRVCFEHGHTRCRLLQEEDEEVINFESDDDDDADENAGHSM